MLKLKLEYPASDQASKKLKLTQKEKHMSEAGYSSFNFSIIY